MMRNVSALSCGDTITTSTTLTSNLGPCTSTGIFMGANGITLDCNGYTISGDGIVDIFDAILLSNNFNKHC